MVRWLADAQAVAIATGRPPSTIRRWAHKGWLERHGTDARGRVLFDVEAAQELARRLALDKAPDVREHQDDSQESAQRAEPG
jgi:hypothetical protein